MASSVVESSVVPLTFDQFLRTRASQFPNEVAVLYASSGAVYEKFTYSQINNFAYRTAKEYSKFAMPRFKSSSPSRVVALLGLSNLDYIVTMAAVTKLGWTALLLSTRISDVAYRHLLAKTNCSDVILQSDFEKTIERVKEDFPFPLNIISMAEPDIYDPEELRGEQIPVEETVFDRGLDYALEAEKPAWIIHSSGSTGLPKPVDTTHKASLNSGQIIMSGSMTSMLTLPLFHAYGLMVVAGAFATGKKIIIFNPYIPLTGPNVVEALKVTNPEQIYLVPYTLKLMAETPGGAEALANCQEVTYGGSSLSDEIGDKLVSSGVNIRSYYGSTETGACLWSGGREDGDNEWNYLQPVNAFASYMQWEQVGEAYELIVKPGWRSQSLTNRPDGSYATSDLWLQHPINPNKWKYYGRRDDILVLSNGEKANPVTFELQIRENPYVGEVAVCGAQRAHLGMLVIPSKKAAGMGQDEVIEKIWETVKQGNEQMPAYARISKEMIAILPIDQDFPKTDKGTTIRPAFYTRFADNIEQLYRNFEGYNNHGGLELSEVELKWFIKKELVQILMLDNPSSLQDETDFFSLGLDSLGAMQVQGKVVRELKTGGKVSQNIVFEQPTLNKLSGYLYRLRTGEKEAVDSQVDFLKALVEKYSNFPQHVPGKSNPDGDYIIVTGATGSLGANIVAQLVTRDSVKKVYCLVRATCPENATQRIIQSLNERRIYDKLSQEQLAKVAAFPSDFSSETLGLSPEVYEELLQNVNIMIHSAWPVNFNMNVTSFEQQHIRGAYNLMSLCLKSHRVAPTSFNFTSSVSTVLATSSSVISETKPTSLENAMPMGYAQSKVITEKLCEIAANTTTMAAHVLRVGQIVGDTSNGCWNANEAIPLTIQAALTIGCLPRPTNDEVLSWLPVDIVAKTCIELLFVSVTDVARDAVFNVCHPGLISWNNDILPALKAGGLKFDEVTPTEWLARLKASNQDPKVNPPVKLLDYFKGKYKKDTVDNMPYFKTEEASKHSKALGECKVVDGNLVGKFVKFWKETAW